MALEGWESHELPLGPEVEPENPSLYLSSFRQAGQVWWSGKWVPVTPPAAVSWLRPPQSSPPWQHLADFGQLGVHGHQTHRPVGVVSTKPGCP